MAEANTFTIETIYSLPEGKRAELVDGNLYMMAPLNRRHQELVGALYRVIGNHIASKGCSCIPYVAPFAVFLSKDDKNYVEPDISVVCDKSKLTDHGCEGAPDWIIEVVSPGSQKMDYMIKLFKYKTAGVKEYWIVDPKDETVAIYDFAKDDMEKYTFQDKIVREEETGFSVCMAELVF